MTIAFPGESADYRAARDRLLDQEIKLPRLTEAMAVSRAGAAHGRTDPAGLRPRWRRSRWRSEERETIGAIQTGQAQPRHLQPHVPARSRRPLRRARDRQHRAPAPKGRPGAHHAPRCSTNSTMPPSTPPSTSTSPSSRTRHSHGRSPSPRSAAGVTFASRPRPPTPTTACSTATRTQPVTSGAQTLLRPHGQRSGPASHQHPRAALEPPRSHPRRTSQRLARATELLTSDDDNGHPGSRLPTRMPWRPAVQSATISVMSLGVSSAGRRGFGRRARAKWDAVELRREDRQELFAGLAHQPLRCTTSSKGRRFKRVPGLSGRSAG